jgi:hypothetical protein
MPRTIIDKEPTDEGIHPSASICVRPAQRGLIADRHLTQEVIRRLRSDGSEKFNGHGRPCRVGRRGLERVVKNFTIVRRAAIEKGEFFG